MNGEWVRALAAIAALWATLGYLMWREVRR